MSERKLIFVEKIGISCNKKCFGTFGEINYRRTTNNFVLDGRPVFIFDCHAPNAPGGKSKLGCHRICVVDDPNLSELIKKDQIQIKDK